MTSSIERYLCALWPSIQQVEWYEGVPEHPLLDLDKLNGSIRGFRMGPEADLMDALIRTRDLTLGQ